MSILTLALGIGANTAVYSVVRSALLVPPPFADPNSLAVVLARLPAGAAARGGVGAGLLRSAGAAGARDFRRGRGLHHRPARTSPAAANPSASLSVRASQRFQSTLGLPLAAGRWFTSEEDAPTERCRSLCLSDGLWRRRFGSERSVIGQTIRLNDRPHLVVGIMTAAGTFPRLTKAAEVPAAFTAAQRAPDGRGNEFLEVVARLAPGRDDGAGARRADTARTGTWKRRFLADSPRWTVEMRPLAGRSGARHSARGARRVRRGRPGAAGRLRQTSPTCCCRARRTGGAERAVRAAVGATASRLRRQLLVETGILGLAGGGIGVLLAVAVLAAACARNRVDPATSRRAADRSAGARASRSPHRWRAACSSG